MYWQIIGSYYCTFPMTKTICTCLSSKCFLVQSCVARLLYFHVSRTIIAYSTSTSCWPLIAAESNNVLWAKRGAGHVKLVPSCDISALLKILHLALHLFSNMRLCDHVVTSYVAIIMYLWTDMELRKFIFTENSDFFILWNLDLCGIALNYSLIIYFSSDF